MGIQTPNERRAARRWPKRASSLRDRRTQVPIPQLHDEANKKN
jgi:hypothetical protein